MSREPADVTLVVPATPDSIAVVRQTVSGICEALGADARTIGDIKLAATEACTNVVLHAYGGRGDGAIELDARATEDELLLVVRDHGSGMTPSPHGRRTRSRPAADRRADDDADDRGGRRRRHRGEHGVRAERPAARSVSDAVYRAAIACGPLLPQVLDRLLGALAARADLSVDRLNDLAMVGDAVSAAAPDAVVDGRLEVVATPTERGLELSFGPFAPGGAARVRRAGGLPGGGDLFAASRSRSRSCRTAPAERLTLQIVRSRRSAVRLVEHRPRTRAAELSARRSRRETCIWEMPMRAAICDWVRPSSKRIATIWRSRSARPSRPPDSSRLAST